MFVIKLDNIQSDIPNYFVEIASIDEEKDGRITTWNSILCQSDPEKVMKFDTQEDAELIVVDINTIVEDWEHIIGVNVEEYVTEKPQVSEAL